MLNPQIPVRKERVLNLLLYQKPCTRAASYGCRRAKVAGYAEGKEKDIVYQ